MLAFAGRGSAFTENHNAAFFIENKTLVLLDCPMSAFQKYKYLDFKFINKIIILVTHTHGDHISGIGTMIHFAKYKLNKPVIVAAPSENVRRDLNLLLHCLEGCDKNGYMLITASQLEEPWCAEAIATEHVQQLPEKCFGYCLKFENKNIVYTGDTKTLRPFLPYLKKGDILYTEISYYQKKHDKDAVHLSLEEYKPVLLDLLRKGIKVYLMHLDNEKEILRQIQGTGLKFAPLYLFRKEIPVRLVPMKSSELSEAKKLYEQAFPPEERAPVALLCLKHHLADVDVLSVYAGKQWAGFFYIVNFKNLSYIFYFAVRPELRNKGIGSQALQRLQKFYYGRKLFLAVEQPDILKADYENRISRKYFYLRNGFQDLHRRVQEATVIYELLGIGGDVLPEEYQKLIASYTGKFLYRNITMKILED